MKNAMQYVSFYGKDIDNVKPTGELMRRNVILLNSDVIPNAPYFTFTWYLRTTEELQVQHTHDFDEIIGSSDRIPTTPKTSMASSNSWWMANGSCSREAPFSSFRPG